jgi:dienelactone hydrolase
MNLGALQGKLCVGILLLALSAASLAKLVEDVVDVQVSVTDMFGKMISQPIKVTIFHDDERNRSPFIVLNHGRPADPEDAKKMGRARFLVNSKYFVSMGFAVLVPTRVGYGVSGGGDVEYSGTCSAKNYWPAYEAAAQESLKVIEYARTLPYVDAERGLIIGQSFGGTTAIAVAAKQVPGIVAAVNFSGGGGGNPVSQPENPCRTDLLRELFGSYGKTVKIPTLWLYSENDKFSGKEKPHQWFDSFIGHGGKGEFMQLPPFSSDGHDSFARNPSAWRPILEWFFHGQGF